MYPVDLKKMFMSHVTLYYVFQANVTVTKKHYYLNLFVVTKGAYPLGDSVEISKMLDISQWPSHCPAIAIARQLVAQLPN